MTSAGPAAGLRILPVESRRDRGRFLNLTREIYAGDAAWIQPLDIERRLHLSPKNPFFEHGEAALWIAERGGRAVGRISAQIDRLHLERHDPQGGFFGMLEAEDDAETFGTLFQTAEAWLAERGMQRALGPFNFSINQECGLLIEGFDVPPRVMLTHARPYYAPRVEACGYAKERDLVAYRSGPPETWPEVPQKARLDGGAFQFRHLRKRDLDSELTIIRQLFNDAWSENWGFVPFTDAELKELGDVFKHLVPAEYVVFAEQDGEPVGFVAALPDVNQALAGLNGKLLPSGWAKLLWRMKVRTPTSTRMALIGLRKDFRRSVAAARLMFGLVDGLRTVFLRRGVRSVDMSWILEENRPVRRMAEAMGNQVYKRFRIYSKQLAPAQPRPAGPA